MEKSDIKLSLLVGEIIAILSFGILKNFGITTKLIYFIWPIFLPLLCLAGMLVAWQISKKIPFVLQAAKFALVGAVNTVVDLGVLNLLILFTQITSGIYFSIFKGISFLVAVINSYFWNKFWAFKKKGEAKDQTPQAKSKEFSQFMVVSIAGFLLNLVIATLVVNTIGPQFGLSAKKWASVGAVAGTLFVMVWNFLGYKFIVFK
jgi:putative flippase GtrA